MPFSFFSSKSGNPKWELTLDVLYDIVGTSIFAVGISCFSSPNNIAPGGVSGMAILVEYLIGLPVSMVSLFFNIPLLLLAWRFLGRRFTLRTLRTVAIMTGTMWLSEQFLVPYHGEMILASLFGGVLEGLGLAIVFLRGSTTGGTDVASRLIQLKFPHISIGRLMLAVDGSVLLLSALVYRNVENALYGLITIFTMTRLLDSVLYGMDTGKVLLVMSEHHDAIVAAIWEKLDRGCTLLHAQGAYTKQDRPVLLCAVRKNQYHALKQLVYAIDPGAFVLSLEAGEVIGEGFKTPPLQ
ncbi:YitT family protein [Ruminococcaceae bacterium OttesenSCG-928-L11]|nr:YitT family protein [Ruminococcaceae bacterium OttesenSCG-928-L11]